LPAIGLPTGVERYVVQGRKPMVSG